MTIILSKQTDMKKFFSKKSTKEVVTVESSNKEVVTVESSNKEVVDKDDTTLVKCMDCGNRTKLFYDLSSSIKDEGDEKDLEGQDLEDRDPIRCVLCRKFTKCKDNEPIQCEDCQTNATIFYWSGPDLDVILCDECFKEDGGYESTPQSE
jgi:ribosomal protein S27E